MDMEADMDPQMLTNPSEGSDFNTCTTTSIQSLPIEILQRILFIPNNRPLEFRLISKLWNSALTIDRKLVFVYDGDSEAKNGFFTKIVLYFISTGRTTIPRAWTILRIQNASIMQLYPWIQPLTIGQVKDVEFKNCDLSYETTVELLSMFVNIRSFTFTLESRKKYPIPSSFQPFLRPVLSYNLDHLKKLKNIRLAVPCELEFYFLGFFNEFSKELDNLSITIQNPVIQLLEIIGETLRVNSFHLKTLDLALEAPTGPNKDDYDIMQHFFIPVHDLKWAEIAFPSLISARINHNPSVEVNTDAYRLNFFPFLRTLISGKSLKNLEIGTIVIHQEIKYDQFINELNEVKVEHNPNLEISIGVFLEYNSTHKDTEPIRPVLSVSSMVIESSAETSRIGRVVARTSAPDLRNLKILNRTNSLTDYGLHIVTNKYSKLKVLVVDEQSVQRDCPARIGDNEIQAIFRDLKDLEMLSISANMEDLSDGGLTGFRKSSCSEYLRGGFAVALTIPVHEPRGRSIASLKCLCHLELRGVGQQVTDMTLFHGMNKMLQLRECSITGRHKITEVGVSYLKERAGVSPNIKIRIS